MNIQTIIGMAEVFRSSIEYNQENWKKDILERWNKTYDMPRKMKKRTRKELQLEWNIACYNPMDNWF